MFVLVVGLPLVGIGGFFVYVGLSTMRDQARLNHTVISVPATIISSAVRRSTTKRAPGSTAASYWAHVEFSYEYDGQTRKSDKVWPVGESRSEADAHAVVERYPPGAKVGGVCGSKRSGHGVSREAMEPNALRLGVRRLPAPGVHRLSGNLGFRLERPELRC